MLLPPGRRHRGGALLSREICKCPWSRPRARAWGLGVKQEGPGPGVKESASDPLRDQEQKEKRRMLQHLPSPISLSPSLPPVDPVSLSALSLLLFPPSRSDSPFSCLSLPFAPTHRTADGGARRRGSAERPARLSAAPDAGRAPAAPRPTVRCSAARATRCATRGSAESCWSPERLRVCSDTVFL